MALDREAARAAQLELTSPADAGRLWARIDRRITALAPVIPWVNPTQIDLTSAGTGNYQYNPHYGALFDQLWVR